MAHRGLSDDWSRGPLPNMEFLKREIRTLAAYQYNIFSPYFEHTFAYTSTPIAAFPGGAMTPDEARYVVRVTKLGALALRARALQCSIQLPLLPCQLIGSSWPVPVAIPIWPCYSATSWVFKRPCSSACTCAARGHGIQLSTQRDIASKLYRRL
jgi:hypothetical protein